MRRRSVEHVPLPPSPSTEDFHRSKVRTGYVAIASVLLAAVGVGAAYLATRHSRLSMAGRGSIMAASGLVLGALPIAYAIWQSRKEPQVIGHTRNGSVLLKSTPLRVDEDDASDDGSDLGTPGGGSRAVDDSPLSSAQRESEPLPLLQIQVTASQEPIPLPVVRVNQSGVSALAPQTQQLAVPGGMGLSREQAQLQQRPEPPRVRTVTFAGD